MKVLAIINGIFILPAVALLGLLLGASITLCRWAGEMLVRWLCGAPLS